MLKFQALTTEPISPCRGEVVGSNRGSAPSGCAIEAAADLSDSCFTV
jgi:hypothetical protein